MKEVDLDEYAIEFSNNKINIATFRVPLEAFPYVGVDYGGLVTFPWMTDCKLKVNVVDKIETETNFYENQEAWTREVITLAIENKNWCTEGGLEVAFLLNIRRLLLNDVPKVFIK